jgi:hypothetical protein
MYCTRIAKSVQYNAVIARAYWSRSAGYAPKYKKTTGYGDNVTNVQLREWCMINGSIQMHDKQVGSLGRSCFEPALRSMPDWLGQRMMKPRDPSEGHRSFSVNENAIN